MIRAFAAALEDDNLLVRRGALDLLLASMRVDSAAVTKAQADDRTILMRAATGVVLRRDLSLNRRLYTWLLGPDEKSDVQVAYFRQHGLELLKSTLKVWHAAFSGSSPKLSGAASRMKCFRHPQIIRNRDRSRSSFRSWINGKLAHLLPAYSSMMHLKPSGSSSSQIRRTPKMSVPF
jgi:hypothetical protein